MLHTDLEQNTGGGAPIKRPYPRQEKRFYAMGGQVYIYITHTYIYIHAYTARVLIDSIGIRALCSVGKRGLQSVFKHRLTRNMMGHDGPLAHWIREDKQCEWHCDRPVFPGLCSDASKRLIV